MTKKQKRFVEEYLIDLNATQAAIRAGYSTQAAKEIGCENLTKPNIQTAIDKAIAERSKRTGVNQDRVVLELAKIAFVNMSDFMDMDTVTIKDTATNEDLATVSSVKVKTFPTKTGELGVEREIRTHDKIRALELLGKHLGMFTDKLKFESPIPVFIQDDMCDSDDESDE